MRPLLAEWLSIRDVAQQLGVSPKQVRKWIRAGQFKEIAVFSKRLIRISKPSYLAFVAKYIKAA